MRARTVCTVRTVSAAALAVAPLLALGACERSRRAPKVDTSTAPAVAPPDSAAAAAPAAQAWERSAGPVMLVRGSGTETFVVFPQYTDSTLPDTVRFDAAPVRGLTLDLLDRHGLAGAARVAGMAPREWHGEDCLEWPTADLQPTAGGALPPWNVAFSGGRVRALALDSIEMLPRADSARLAAEVTRLASTLPNDTAAAFRGIPFLVRSAYRFAPAPGVQALVANVVRNLNQEASPREEQILLVAERDSADPGARFRTVYSERTSDTEDNVVTSEVLAAVAFAETPGRTALVLARAGSESIVYALLERTPTGQWRVRWTSVTTGC